MGFFRRDDDDKDEQPQEQGAPPAPPEELQGTPHFLRQRRAHPMSYDPNAMAGVPEHGRQRMAETKDIFTSDLSVDEFVLTKAAGFEPVGLRRRRQAAARSTTSATSSSTWKISQEMAVLSQAMYNARELAMTRMEEEADQLGADGVIGVRMEIGRYEWGPDMAEFLAIGTAVRHSEGKLHRAPNGKPFSSDLSGQDFYKLISSGHRPLGLVMGSCVYHVAHQSMRQAFKQARQNVEMENFTQALYEARELAMERMQAEAREVQAEGVVGVRLVEASHGWGSHIIEFFAIGTAIVPIDGGEPLGAPRLTLPVPAGGARPEIGTPPGMIDQAARGCSSS